MDLIVKRVEVWAASIKDQVGGLARKLKGLKEAGADLDFVIARRTPEDPGKGVVFVTPLRGDREIAAAANRMPVGPLFAFFGLFPFRG